MTFDQWLETPEIAAIGLTERDVKIASLGWNGHAIASLDDQIIETRGQLAKLGGAA